VNSYWSKTPVSSSKPSARGERLAGLGLVAGLFTMCKAKEDEPSDDLFLSSALLEGSVMNRSVILVGLECFGEVLGLRSFLFDVGDSAFTSFGI